MVALPVGSTMVCIFTTMSTLKLCSNGHVSRRTLGFPREHPLCPLTHTRHTTTSALPLKAAFDPRILASVCFFATDIHTATLGKGKKDDSLERVRRGDLMGKGELVVG
jgi:hypothetical protein